MSDIVLLIVLGGLLGFAGQVIRAVVGLKKAQEEAPGKAAHEWFNRQELQISLLIGVVAGMLAAVSQYESSLTVTRDLMLGIVAAGYAGSDFIMGLMKKWVP